MTKKKTFIAIGLCVVGIGLLVWLGLSKNLTYYKTVSEAKNEKVGKTFRLAGNVKPNSIKESSKNNTFSFVVTNGETDIFVEYKNPFPELLQDGVPAVSQGKWNSDKSKFIADSIMVKHGSDYAAPNDGKELAKNQEALKE